MERYSDNKGKDMPTICFEIEVNTDTGEVKAGSYSEDQEKEGPEEDKQYLQPVASLEEALDMAKSELSNIQSGQANPQMEEEDAMAAMRRGYAGKSKMGMMRNRMREEM